MPIEAAEKYSYELILWKITVPDFLADGMERQKKVLERLEWCRYGLHTGLRRKRHE